jgi:soluble lytic murein transglycosylase-like protein
MRRWLWQWLVLLSILSLPCYGDIYVYADPQGNAYLTNVPVTDPAYTFIRVTRIPKTLKAMGNSKNGAIPLTYGKASGLTSKSRRKPFNINNANRKKFTPHIQRIAKQHGLDPRLMHAVISAESSFNPRAVSHAGAMGLMQLMPGTARRFGVTDPFNPEQNLTGGARYLRWLLDKFNNDQVLALAAYNAGENAVIKYGHRIPPYAETQTYISRVLDFYAYYLTVN